MPQKQPRKSFLASLVLVLAFVAANIVYQKVAGDPFREGKMIIFFFTIMVAGCVWVAGRFDSWLAAVIGIASAEWAFANGPVYGIVPTVGVFGFLYLGHVASQNRWTTHLVLRATTWLQAVFCLLQIFHVPTFGSNDPYFKDLIIGSMGHPVVVGAWFAAVAPLAWFYWSRAEFLICVALCLWSGSTMAIVALFAGGGYVLVRRMPKLWLLAIPGIVVLASGVYFLPEVEFFSLSGRMLPWKVAYEWILKSPWVGYGPGSWNGRYVEWGVQYARKWDHLHGTLIRVAFELGLPALFLSLVATWSILRKTTIVYGAVMAALLVSTVGGFTLELASTGFLFVVALGLGLQDNEDRGIGKFPGGRV